MKETRAEYLPIQKLRPFEGHPFKVTDNEEMDQLVWSVLTQGLLTPLVVRPLENGEYEVISGHRRLHACKKAGIETVPALIYAIDRDAAAIALVDSNLQREHIRNKIRRALESEKPELKLQAKAVTQKMDPLRKQQRIAKRIAERSAPKVENLLAMERQQETEVTRGRMKGARHDERNKSRTFSR